MAVSATYTGATAAVPRVGVALRVPPNWYEVDLHPARRVASIQYRVGERAAVNATAARHRDETIRALKRLARQAWATGARYFACMAENFDTLPLEAAVTVSLVRAGTGGYTPNTDPVAIVRSLARKPWRTEDDTWLETELVELPSAGPAARIYGVEDVEYPGDLDTVRTVLTHTILPVPNSDHLAVIAAGSPLLGPVAPLHDLFATVTSTFHFTRP
jgi:hypothetical protein